MTDANGEYAFYCLRPTPYPIPFDGPAGKLLQLLDRHPYRPAHIHLIVSGPHVVLSAHRTPTYLRGVIGSAGRIQAHHDTDIRQGQQVLG